MKILIVDDEKLTREGIISSLQWDAFGITEIYEADDGLNGIKTARLYKPEIILSDVRMPRMNGIEMAKEIHKTLPSSSMILMSGYSDKEYLMEAIKLKVISYVEKPIDSEELETSIKNAMEEQQQYKKDRIKTDYHLKYTQNKLGLQLVSPHAKEKINDSLKQFEELGYLLKPAAEFTTVMITLKTAISGISDQDISGLYGNIDESVKKYHMQYILATKNDEYILLHLFTNHTTSIYSVTNILKSISTFLDNSYQYYIAVGKTVSGIKNIYESYNSAVSLLQSSFFYDYNSIIEPEAYAVQPALDSSLTADYTEALEHENKDEVLENITKVYQHYRHNQHILPAYVKDVYHKLFTILIQNALTLHLSGFYEEDSALVLEYMSSDRNLTELNQALTNKVNLFFSSLQEQSKDNTTIYAIKEFIRKNYHEDTLSVKDISEHVFLSSSYLCTLFKNETGKTLNQYITEFRIDKAKAMLKDSHYKISDISAKVGYSDGNYFSKTFKKIVDLSPTEYRERYGK